MSKVGPVVNGDPSDGMVGSMDSRAMRSRDFLRDDWSDKVSKVFSCDVDHMYASVNDVQTKEREIVVLKEMLKANLDYIQTQSEMIYARDKEIAALREERDTLRQRFQRMERRVTLQRHKDDPGPLPIPGTSLVLPPTELEPPVPMPMALPTSPVPEAVQSPLKRRRVSGGSLSRRTVSGCSDTKRSRSISDSNDVERRVRSRPPLTSDKEYYTAVGDSEAWGPLDLHVAPDAVAKKEDVQVPSWREKVLSPLYVIEGTENVEDEVFLKRHHKLESDERRRKRWDLQRIREQSQLERLKQRVDKKRVVPMSPERAVSSFYPALEDVQEVSVGPCLPVVAFGLPLRTFEPCEFNLSWSAECGQKYLSLRNR